MEVFTIKNPLFKRSDDTTFRNAPKICPKSVRYAREPSGPHLNMCFGPVGTYNVKTFLSGDKENVQVKMANTIEAILACV